MAKAKEGNFLSSENVLYLAYAFGEISGSHNVAWKHLGKMTLAVRI